MMTVTLNLPDSLVLHADNAAQMLHCEREDVLASTLEGMMPQWDNVPMEMHNELLRMTWLDDRELMMITQQKMSAEEQTCLAELSTNNGTLTSKDQQHLQFLRNHYGEITLRKARAYAVLSVRSGKLLLEKYHTT